MPFRRAIEEVLYAEVERAAERHQKARDEVIAMTKSLHRQSKGPEEDDLRMKDAETALWDARKELFAALKRYNDFVSGGNAPES